MLCSQAPGKPSTGGALLDGTLPRCPCAAGPRAGLGGGAAGAGGTQRDGAGGAGQSGAAGGAARHPPDPQPGRSAPATRALATARLPACPGLLFINCCCAAPIRSVHATKTPLHAAVDQTTRFGANPPGIEPYLKWLAGSLNLTGVLLATAAWLRKTECKRGRPVSTHLLPDILPGFPAQGLCYLEEWKEHGCSAGVQLCCTACHAHLSQASRFTTFSPMNEPNSFTSTLCARWPTGSTA